MNILYLLKTLKTEKLSEVVANIDEAPIDINLAMWDAIDAGEIELDEAKDRIVALKEATPWHNEDIANKFMRVIHHYAQNEASITRGRLASELKDPATGDGYKLHECLMTLQYLIDSGKVVEETISVPEIKGKRPYHKFVFLCLPDNPNNEEWNAKAVNRWIANFKEAK